MVSFSFRLSVVMKRLYIYCKVRMCVAGRALSVQILEDLWILSASVRGRISQLRLSSDYHVSLVV